MSIITLATLRSAIFAEDKTGEPSPVSQVPPPIPVATTREERYLAEQTGKYEIIAPGEGTASERARFRSIIFTMVEQRCPSLAAYSRTCGGLEEFIPDQTVRVKAAMATLAPQGITREKILADKQVADSVLKTEADHFKQASKDRVVTVIAPLQAELAAVQKEYDELADQQRKLLSRGEELSKRIQVEEGKTNSAASSFLNALDTIQHSVDNLVNHL